MLSAAQFDPETLRNIDIWMNGSYDNNTKEEILRLLDSSPDTLQDSFYTNLKFGTGGLRGLMGVGTNRINIYTVRTATQGLANYVLTQPLSHEKKRHSAFVGYDCRNSSREFAEETAKVFAANSIEVYLCEEMRPTPFVSFGCRYHKCTTAVMITASHNPPQYNGYKVYWSDGAQVVPPIDSEIIREINRVTSLEQIKILDDLESSLIHLIGHSFDQTYLNIMDTLSLHREQNHKEGHQVKIVYTPLHGTGMTLVPKILKQWGFTQIHLVHSQSEPNGNFPTVKYPNPEDPAAMQSGVDLLKSIHGDLLLGTDPDADRVGVGVMHHDRVHLLNGHQIACILLHHILEGRTKLHRLPENAAFIKTLSTTELFTAIAKSYNKPTFDVLNGFKYIAELIHKWETSDPVPYQYIFGGEDSYGYMAGTHTRDKDAVSICALLAEACLHAKLQNKTLIDIYETLAQRFGKYSQGLLSINFPESKEGHAQMEKKMGALIEHPPEKIGGYSVIYLENYRSGLKKELSTGKNTPLELSKSDMLVFRLKNHGKVIVRPSGTEPKIKIYAELEDRQENVDSLLRAMNTLLM